MCLGFSPRVPLHGKVDVSHTMQIVLFSNATIPVSNVNTPSSFELQLALHGKLNVSHTMEMVFALGTTWCAEGGPTRDPQP